MTLSREVIRWLIIIIVHDDTCICLFKLYDLKTVNYRVFYTINAKTEFDKVKPWEILNKHTLRFTIAIKYLCTRRNAYYVYNINNVTRRYVYRNRVLVLVIKRYDLPICRAIYAIKRSFWTVVYYSLQIL